MLFRAHMHAPAPIPWIPSMERQRSSTRLLYLYFSLLALLVNVASPQWVLDIQMIATADGEPNPEEDALVPAEIG